ncbi:MAG: hypothetical protein JJ913_06720 [Rhizobiaceae bacterium]|nr:hypothetical protein [Rhizobiaceae bacterium]
MDSIERAIRDALAKGDASNRAYRERVYRSVLAALDRANASNPDLTLDMIERRQNALKAHITAIEREYVPAVEPVVEAPAAAPDPAAAPLPEPRIDRPIRNEPAPARFAEEERIGATAEDRLAPEGDEPSGRKRPYAAMFVAVTFVAALAIGAWWASETGLFGQPDTSSPNPPAEVEAEEFDPGGPPPLGPAEGGQPRDWVTLFSPADPSTVVAPTGATATVGEDDAGAYLEIRSGGEAVLFDVPAAVLQSLAGGGAVFDVVARSEEGDETQISVSCNFGELGDCGRKRYLVGYEIADYLFDIEMPRGSPGTSGTIAIVPDVSGGKRALHVFEIRVAAQ